MRGGSIRLYTQKLNPYTEKVAGALALKGLAYERVESEDPADIQRWSPVTHQLPVLEIDGKRRHESSEIVKWIDELFPDPPLVAADPTTASAQRNLAEWSETSFIWYWNRWRTVRFPAPGDAEPADQSLLGRIKSGIGRKLGGTARQISRAEARELVVISEINDRLNDLNGFLGDRPFFHSDEPSIADLSVYAMLRILFDGPIPHTAEHISNRPRLVAFMKRMEEETGRGARDPGA